MYTQLVVTYMCNNLVIFLDGVWTSLPLSSYKITFLANPHSPPRHEKLLLSITPIPPRHVYYIILNNEMLKSNSSIFPRSEGYITTVHSLGSIWTNFQ